MSAKTPVYIIGQGGHAKVIRSILDQSEELAFAGYIDEADENSFISKHKGKESDVALALGIGENFIRKKLYSKFSELGYYFPVIQSRYAIIADDIKIGEGSVIMPGAIINADAMIGQACVINSGAIIEHDVQMDDYSSAAPAAVISGGCTIGEGAYVGANATIIQNKMIGNWSVLGAGATLIEDIGDNVLAVGVPAVVKKTIIPGTLVFKCS